MCLATINHLFQVFLRTWNLRTWFPLYIHKPQPQNLVKPLHPGFLILSTQWLGPLPELKILSWILQECAMLNWIINKETKGTKFAKKNGAQHSGPRPWNMWITNWVDCSSPVSLPTSKSLYSKWWQMTSPFYPFSFGNWWWFLNNLLRTARENNHFLTVIYS